MKSDPVCGMSVEDGNAFTLQHKGRTYYFCSEGCRATFEKAPEKYERPERGR